MSWTREDQMEQDQMEWSVMADHEHEDLFRLKVNNLKMFISKLSEFNHDNPRKSYHGLSDVKEAEGVRSAYLEKIEKYVKDILFEERRRMPKMLMYAMRTKDIDGFYQWIEEIKYACRIEQNNINRALEMAHGLR